MKLPGPDHPIEITTNPKTVRVTFAGKVVAESRHALALKEAAYPAVQYIPRTDVRMELLHPTSHASHCPIRAMPAITASRRAAAAPPMRCGAMRSPSPPWPRSLATSPSIPTASTGSRRSEPEGAGPLFFSLTL